MLALLALAGGLRAHQPPLALRHGSEPAQDVLRMAQERRDGPDPYKHPPSMLRRDSGGSWRAWRGSGGDVARRLAAESLTGRPRRR